MDEDEIIIEFILNPEGGIAHNINLALEPRVLESNLIRQLTIETLLQGFDQMIFYAPVGHPMRMDNLFYQLAFGPESRLAGTGLREVHFRTVFEAPQFEEVISYFYPQMIGGHAWNLGDPEVLRDFCNGIFNFTIPNYAEIMPIRLASYFYQDYLLPIFKISHLEMICRKFPDFALDHHINSRGDKLYSYNLFLRQKMDAIPFNNHVKSNIAHQVYYAVVLYHKLIEGEGFLAILNSYHRKWERNFIVNAHSILIELNILPM